MAADFDGIRQLYQRYGRAVDDRDIPTLRSLFHPEVTIASAKGPLDLDGWIATMEAPRAFPVSMHLIGEPVVDFGEDGTSATMDTCAVAYQVDGDKHLTVGVRYQDTAVVLDGRWVFHTRATRTVWMR